MIKVFTGTLDFEANTLAEKWCKDNGYSVGIMQGLFPRGILHGNVLISKWRNLSESDKKRLDGVMTGNMRNGPVQVLIYTSEPKSAEH